MSSPSVSPVVHAHVCCLKVHWSEQRQIEIDGTQASINALENTEALTRAEAVEQTEHGRMEESEREELLMQLRVEIEKLSNQKTSCEIKVFTSLNFPLFYGFNSALSY
ncbi:hypothetical protein ATANTOWER_022731 [Ataeniobius toweri]|uniref:Uncharacterized protein n=1 Tax=Ataeniobius toweri TaxID=208326 RepID=A0ABU7A7P7_9TELE|nr:hypothetical protein [Ataeniobius toweri]